MWKKGIRKRRSPFGKRCVLPARLSVAFRNFLLTVDGWMRCICSTRQSYSITCPLPGVQAGRRRPGQAHVQPENGQPLCVLPCQRDGRGRGAREAATARAPPVGSAHASQRPPAASGSSRATSCAADAPRRSSIDLHSPSRALLGLTAGELPHASRHRGSHLRGAGVRAVRGASAVFET